MAEYHQLRSLKDLAAPPAFWKEWNQDAEDRARVSPSADVPLLDHLSYRDFDQVYEPAEDTYLLLDALLYEFDQGNNQLATATHATTSDSDTADQCLCHVLEIGCGSGVPTAFFQQMWRKRKTTLLYSVVTDINPKALKVTQQTCRCNGGGAHPQTAMLEALQCDLGSALVPQLEGKVDVIMFNPPYVVTDDAEVGTPDISAAWAGGLGGRRVVDRALPQLARLLRKPTGVLYLVTVDDNRPWELAQDVAKLGWRMKPLFRRKALNEFLTIQKVTAMVCVENDKATGTTNLAERT